MCDRVLARRHKVTYARTPTLIAIAFYSQRWWPSLAQLLLGSQRNHVWVALQHWRNTVMTFTAIIIFQECNLYWLPQLWRNSISKNTTHWNTVPDLHRCGEYHPLGQNMILRAVTKVAQHYFLFMFLSKYICFLLIFHLQLTAQSSRAGFLLHNWISMKDNFYSVNAG